MPLAFFANVGGYLCALWLLARTGAQHTAQVEDWRVVAVVILVGWQALWLYWLRRRSLGTFVFSLLLWWAAVLVGGFDPLALQPGVLLAAFSFATESAGRRRLVAVTAGMLGTAGAFVAVHALYPLAGVARWDTPAVLVAWTLAAAGLVGIPAALGAWYAQLRDHAERIAALAHESASGEAIRTAEAVAAERRTLAQELHDTSSAHLAALITLSTVAQTTAAGGGTAHERLVEQVRDEGQKLYSGYERMLSRMLQEDRTVTESHRPGHGQHTVSELADLIEEHRGTTGVLVAMHNSPGFAEIDRRLGPMRSHIAYRVTQEALSNVRKHAPGAAIAITVEDDGSSLLLRIENEPLPPPGPASLARGEDVAGASRSPSLGYGLAGMRDRLAAAGGSLRTGPRHAGGWAVHALLPHPPHRRGASIAWASEPGAHDTDLERHYGVDDTGRGDAPRIDDAGETETNGVQL